MTRPPRGERARAPQDGEVGAGTPSPGSGDRRVDSAPTPARHGPLAPADGAGSPQRSQAEDDVLTLPPGALVALRRSGGLLFSMCEVVVYPDGRLVMGTRGGGRPSQAEVVGALPAAQLGALRRILSEIDFARLPVAPPAQPRPDAYAYELVTRPGRLAPPLEVFDGAIPPALVPLIRLCSGLLAHVD